MNGHAKQQRPKTQRPRDRNKPLSTEPIELSSTLPRPPPDRHVSSNGVRYPGESSFPSLRLHSREEGLVDPSRFDSWADEAGGRASEEDDDEYTNMPSDLRPELHRAMDGRSQQPLLSGKNQGYDDDEPVRPSPTRRRSRTFHEMDPEALAARATRQRYIYASFFLVLSLISFVVQTETASYVASELGWKKSYCMLYATPDICGKKIE
jgi:hypothetical protein